MGRVAWAGLIVGLAALVVAVVGTIVALLKLGQERHARQAADATAATQRRALAHAALRQEYVLSHDGVTPGIIAGTEPLPSEWLEPRLRQLGFGD